MRSIPQIWRPVGNPQIMIQTPWDGTSARTWLNAALPKGARRVEYAGRGRWTVSRRHLQAVLDACIDRHGSVELTWDSSATEKCTVQCQNALSGTVDSCECVCGGDYHGGNAGRLWANVTGDLLVSSQIIRRVIILPEATRWEVAA